MARKGGGGSCCGQKWQLDIQSLSGIHLLKKERVCVYMRERYIEREMYRKKDRAKEKLNEAFLFFFFLIIQFRP